MIDINIRPRSSGKTEEIIELCNKDPYYSIMIVHNTNEMHRVNRLTSFQNVYSYKSIPVRLDHFTDIYFDEYFLMEFNFKHILRLDELGKKVHIYGTPAGAMNKELEKYLKIHYPEELI